MIPLALSSSLIGLNRNAFLYSMWDYSCLDGAYEVELINEIGGCVMSLADNIFINMCKDILDNGTSTEGEKVRP